MSGEAKEQVAPDSTTVCYIKTFDIHPLFQYLYFLRLSENRDGGSLGDMEVGVFSLEFNLKPVCGSVGNRPVNSTVFGNITPLKPVSSQRSRNRCHATEATQALLVCP